MGRREFVALMAGVTAAATSGVACAPAESAPTESVPASSAGTVFYASVGPDLGLYTVDPTALTLTWDSVTRVPESVQYVWVHPTLPVMYVAYSNRSKADNNHGVAIYQIDRGTGRLTEFNKPLMLDNRPIHISVDPAGRHLLIAYNQPSNLTVHALNADGSIGEALLTSATQILGEPPQQVATLSVWRQDDPDDLVLRARELLEGLDAGDGVLVLTDIFGATPGNVVSRLLEDADHRVFFSKASRNMPDTSNAVWSWS
jgi:hypothetical protein